MEKEVKINDEGKIKSEIDLQREFIMKIHNVVIEGGYSLSTIISSFELLKFEYMQQSYLNKLSQGANENVKKLQTAIPGNIIKKYAKK